VLDRVPQDSAPERSDKTEPHAERMRGAAVGREIEGFNELHRFLFELVSYELREKAPDFFERAFSRALPRSPASSKASPWTRRASWTRSPSGATS
jgi:hypothetical protein